MDTSTAVLELERLAREAGISINLLCSKAGYDRSSWTRWKGGIAEMSLDKYFNLKEALLKLSKGKIGNAHFKAFGGGTHPPPI